MVNYTGQARISARLSPFRRGCRPAARDQIVDRFMTEKRARHYARVLARGVGVTFHVVRSREGRFFAVQIPSDDCEILTTVMPRRSVRSRREPVRSGA
jgi:hypothetical protein